MAVLLAGLAVGTSRASAERAGERFGGALMQVYFHTDYQAGVYRPTFTLLNDPTDLTSGDGSAYTYTVIAE